MTERLVVIGADAAGMSAASQARRRRGLEELEIIALEKGNFTSYSACGIPYYVGGVVTDLETLVVRTPEQFRSKSEIEVRVRHEVMSIDLDARKVEIRDRDEDRTYLEGFDLLMVASGAVPIRPDLPNSEASGIFGVQWLDHGVAIRKAVEEDEPRRAVVVGAGYIGLEMAEAFKVKGMDVAIVEAAAQPMSTLDEDMGALVAQGVREMGIELYVGEEVKGFETGDGHVSGVVTDARTLPADIVVMGLGVRPNVELAGGAGIPLGTSGGIRVDRRMRTPAEGVWAAGDCAEKFHRVSRRSVTIALGTHANKEGRVAGINIGGGYETFPGVVGTAVSKVCAVEVGRTGLKEQEAAEAGFEYMSVVVESTTRAGYYPETQPIKVKLTAEKQSGDLLGAQIVGQEGAAKRIDVLATALWNEMSVEDMLNMDLSYAPPFSPVWDSVLIAARKAWQAIESA